MRYRRWMEDEDGNIDVPEEYISPEDFKLSIDERGERCIDLVDEAYEEETI